MLIRWNRRPSASTDVSDPVTKLAYQTLQQGKSLLGLAHKEVSTRLMELVAPDASARTVAVPPEMLGSLRQSMDALLELDWKEAQENLLLRMLRGLYLRDQGKRP